MVAGPHVFVTATAATMPDGAEPPPDTYAQTRRALDIVLAALAEAGAGPEHVVRTRSTLTPAADIDEAVRAHGEVFSEIRPASGVIVVAGFVDPAWLVEIEADALLD